MFSLLENVGLSGTLRREGVPFGAALLVAELFYKLGSFTLECLAFLATWYVLSRVQALILSR